jgi:hypothetical protein
MGFLDSSSGRALSSSSGALLRAALVDNWLRGTLPPVDLRAICLVRAMSNDWKLRLGNIGWMMGLYRGEGRL